MSTSAALLLRGEGGQKNAETETFHFASITKESFYLSKRDALVAMSRGMFATNNIAEDSATIP
jgi:hypothetical protein